MPKLVITTFIVLMSFAAAAQTAGFTFQSAGGGALCAPATVNFTNTSSGNPIGYVWEFGNGQSSNQVSPAINYTNPGTYNVKLIAVFNGFVVETTQSLTISPGISANLTADRNYICQPGPINFTASSTGNISVYSWDFGDGTGIVTTSTPTTAHSFSAFGTFTTTVTTNDVSGCTAKATYPVTVQKTPITGSVAPTTGCIPAVVNFSATANVPSGSSISSYTWDFGDGTVPTTTTVGTNIHSYTSVGSYGPSVSITTSEGCINSYGFGGVAYGIPPTNINAYSNKAVYCGSETPVFVAKALNANSYTWDFGDGTTQTISDTILSHKYLTLGTKVVTVTPYYNGCAGVGTSFNIDITGVIAGFDFSNTCANKTTFSYTDTSQGIINSYKWNFGDGGPGANTANAIHNFSMNGSFITTHIVSDSISGCSDTASVTIHTGSSTLTSPDTIICRNRNVRFYVVNDQTPTSATYTWDAVGVHIDNYPSREQPIQAPFFGVFNSNYVTINNGKQYCPDTAYLNHSVTVRGPELNFTGPATLCSGNLWNVVNNSKPHFPGDSVNLWYWNFYLSPKNDTIYQPAPVQYPYAGTFLIKLVAKDKNGCIDSVFQILRVDPSPFVQAIARKDSLCLGQSDSLIAYHSDSLLWTPAAAVPCADCDTILVSPTSSTQYIATARNSLGCTTSDTIDVRVFRPFTAQSIQPAAYICLNDTVTISASPPGQRIVWSPAAGLSSTSVYSPLASPTASTTYTATLTDSANCFSSSTSINVVVKSLPTVDAGPDRIVPYNSAFTLNPLYSSNINTYTWTPSANLNCSNCPNPAGTALQEEVYLVKVVSDSGCIATDSIKISIECKYANLLLPSAFTPNNDSRNDIFYPIARGIRTIKHFVIFNRMGQKMFEANDFNPNDRSAGWNGDFKGQKADPGAYVYMLEAVCETGNIITKKDSFILIR